MELSKLKNIGSEMTKKLYSIGITSAEELKEEGSKEVFRSLKEAYPNTCLVHLYTIQGAIDDVDYDKLSENTKRDLKNYSDSLK